MKKITGLFFAFVVCLTSVYGAEVIRLPRGIESKEQLRIYYLRQYFEIVVPRKRERENLYMSMEGSMLCAMKPSGESDSFYYNSFEGLVGAMASGKSWEGISEGPEAYSTKVFFQKPSWCPSLSSMHLAAIFGRADIVDGLAAKGVSVLARNVYGYTPREAALLLQSRASEAFSNLAENWELVLGSLEMWENIEREKLGIAFCTGSSEGAAAAASPKGSSPAEKTERERRQKRQAEIAAEKQEEYDARRAAQRAAEELHKRRLQRAGEERIREAAAERLRHAEEIRMVREEEAAEREAFRVLLSQCNAGSPGGKCRGCECNLRKHESRHLSCEECGSLKYCQTCINAIRKAKSDSGRKQKCPFCSNATLG
jgi:hypothetical protein